MLFDLHTHTVASHGKGTARDNIEAAIAAAQPGAPSLCAFGGREHAGVIRICGVQACYTVMLLFPDAELAWGWAMAADRMSETLADALTRMVRAQSGENP